MDYSGKDEDRSLPMSKWMRRNDRVDFDMCASSPPSDGFFYASHSRTDIKHTSNEGCEQKVAIPKPQKTTIVQQECSNAEHRGFLKSFAPGNYSSVNEIQTETRIKSGKILNMDSQQLEKWAKHNIRGQELIIHSSDDTAPTPIDHLPQFRRGIPVITKTDDDVGPAGRLVDKFTHTPDLSPCSTPSITPVCSPQVPRRTVNPFFTGDPNTKEDGSWLFRPAVKNDSMLYEAIVDIKPAAGTQPATKNIRYVPKPSQLRELNFFSPTSM